MVFPHRTMLVCSERTSWPHRVAYSLSKARKPSSSVSGEIKKRICEQVRIPSAKKGPMTKLEMKRVVPRNWNIMLSAGTVEARPSGG